MVPVVAGPRSDRMSPNRLEPTTTSNQSGLRTKWAARMSIWNWSVETSGYSAAMADETFVPIGHGVDDAVGLGRRGQMPAGAAAGQLEGVAHDPVGAAAGEHRLLHRQFGVGALVQPAADLGILALAVLAHDQIVDVARLAPGERAGQAFEQAHGAQVDILLEAPADRDQQAPERDMVGHAGKADRAEEDGIEAGQPVEAVLRHEPAGLCIAFAAPVELGPVPLYAEAGAGGLQHPDAFRHDLPADAVAGNDSDTVAIHRIAFGVGNRPSPMRGVRSRAYRLRSVQPCTRPDPRRKQ